MALALHTCGPQTHVFLLFEVTLQYSVAGAWGGEDAVEGHILGQVDHGVKPILWTL